MLKETRISVPKINTPPWVFFMFFKLYKWYQIAQLTTFKECFMEIFLDTPQTWKSWIFWDISKHYKFKS